MNCKPAHAAIVKPRGGANVGTKIDYDEWTQSGRR
jgi:hypothetical protein